GGVIEELAWHALPLRGIIADRLRLMRGAARNGPSVGGQCGRGDQESGEEADKQTGQRPARRDHAESPTIRGWALCIVASIRVIDSQVAGGLMGVDDPNR